MKIKIFKKVVADSYDVNRIESEVNKWLGENNDIEIKDIKQSYDNIDLVYSIFYYEKKELRKVKLDKLSES